MSGIGDAARFQEEFTEEVRFEASHLMAKRTKKQRARQGKRPAYIKSGSC